MLRTLTSRLSLPVAVALMAVAAGARPSQSTERQGEQPVFRGRTETVAIYATALDRYGEMAVNLNRGDFAVEDDGRRQDLTVFVNGLQPITAALLVDTSASMTLNLDLARNAAEQFVIRMLPGDKVRVGSFSDRLDLSKEFTTDRDALLRALRNDLHIGNPTKLWDAVGTTMGELSPLGGRRIIMLLTDGADTLSTEREANILERAREDELMIYVVQFRSNQRALLAELMLPVVANSLSDPRRRNAPPTQGLRELAAQTGGGHFVLSHTDDVNATFTRVMQELHYQYVLGFAPQRFDGKLHDLRVTVGKPGVTVRARRHYRAPSPPEGGSR